MTIPKAFDYSKVTQIALMGGIIVPVKMGTYREFVGMGTPREIFECRSNDRTVVGLSDSVVAMWFSEELDN